ncbi:MAG: alanine racemase [Deltaproteobacteria bacterium]|nr:alanine racemase [Deltaproteobacteria bacterium]
MDHANTWIEIDEGALRRNAGIFRALAGADRKLMAVVKSDAYGHGMIGVARAALAAGADWLGVFSSSEGLALRAKGIDAPVLVLGPTPEGRLAEAVAAGLRVTVASIEAAHELARLAPAAAAAHLKIETGTNRQGLAGDELLEMARVLKRAGVGIEGAYTHFADIEDTTDHGYAEKQLAAFVAQTDLLGRAGIAVRLPHTACTAATILFPDTYFKMVRVGIGLFGLWPSKETHVSAKSLGRNGLDIAPVMTWKTRVAQVKPIAAGDYVGYGRVFRTTRPTRLAVLPVGYADGYDRGLSNAAHVLVRGVRAPVRGRVCMNLTMVDVTDVPGAAAGDEVVLLGRQGDERIAAEDLARLAGTINYEIVTRAAPGAPRVMVRGRQA